MSGNPLEDALSLYQSGRLRDAQKLAERCVERAPDHPEARRLLATILADRGRLAEALTHIQRVVEAHPDHLPAVAALADIQLRAGELSAAEDTLRGAIASDARIGLLHSNLGTVLMRQARIPQAIESYRNALRVQPDFADAQHNLGRALLLIGDLDGAAAQLTTYLTTTPADADARYTLGSIRLAQRRSDATDHLLAAIQLDPAETRYRLDLVQALVYARADEGLTSPADRNALEELLLARYADPDIDPAPLVEVAAELLAADPNFLLLGAHGRMGDLSASDLAIHLASLTRPLFLAMLQGGAIWGPDLEDLARGIRRALLAAASEGALAGLPATIDDLLVALATQAWLNEYVWSADDAERAWLAALGETPREVLIAACYRPLTPGCRDALANIPQAATLIEEQLDAVADRERIAAEVPALAEVADAVSLDVQAQYEANPYPRLQRVNRLTPRRFQDELASVLPLVDRDLLPDTDAPRILIAGCGTGQHVTQTATRYAGAEVLAVDLSAASLAYAGQRARRSGLEVEFMQADILQLGSLGRRFDLIECAGVLHHMADPEAGWRTLLSALADDGVMRIALYSERARHAISAARALFDHLPQTADDIRAARDRLRALAPDHPAAAVLGSRDFYTLSECRDLLFHVQEHRFSIPQLAEIIDRLGLVFLGFELPPGVASDYRERFPDDPAMVSLPDWDAFEQDAPDTFSGMYQFLVRRR
jgi:2-polyprenyl-3-methyl-5-hydroxy-6-metoxy-1,4-benzoquinol methylase/Flp pilus assembly protein TadD